MKTFEIECTGYSVIADLYEGSQGGPVVLQLIGRTSYRRKQHYINFSTDIADGLGATSLVFDYSGHGDSPFDIEDLMPAQHFLEVISVFDWIKEQYPGCPIYVIGSSYGGFLAAKLAKYRAFDKLVLRAPAIYRPQDFYTAKRLEDKHKTQELRCDSKALSNHSLLAGNTKFQGKTLLIVHENDHIIPRPTTDAYATAFAADVVLAEGLAHSLDNVSVDQTEQYLAVIKEWLSSS